MDDQPTTSPVRAVICDFDGTLADSYAAITASVNHVRSAHGLPPLPEAEVRRHVGRGPTHLLEHTVPGTEVATALARYRVHHPTVLRAGTKLLPGVAEALSQLRRAGILLGVCSNKPGPFTRQLLDYLELTPLISVVVRPEDAPRLKPAPDMLLVALRRLGVQPQESLYIGDMSVDIETARAAGVPVWVVPTGSDELVALQAAKPDRVLNHLAEVPRLLGVNA